MRKWLSKFRKMRRQYGSVKAAILLFLFAGYFIVQSTFAVVEYARFVSEEVEYQLAVYSPEGVQKSDLTKLDKIENVLGMSPQRMYTITCGSGAEQKMISVTEMYADYLQQAYDIEAEPAKDCFYLNQSAWEELMNGRTEQEIHMNYIADDMTSGSARFVLTDTLRNDVPMAYKAGNSVTLAGSNSIQLLCSKNDITGETLQKFSHMGYSVQNEQEMRDAVHALEIVMLEIRYGVIIAVLALSFGSVLVREAYREEARKKK